MKTPSVIGGILLVAGCAIGAGMLALPVLAGLCGFFPAVILFFVAWAFMTYTAFLLVEANSYVSGPANLLTLVEKTLGKKAKLLAWVVYLFLFYALLVAYIAGSGGIVAAILDDYLSFSIPDWVIQCFFTIVFSFFISFGTRTIDLLNRFLLAGLIIFYVGIVTLGASHVNMNFLRSIDLSFFLLPIPVLITSFGFHNMVPSLFLYMKGDKKKVRTSLFWGSSFSLIIYLTWTFFLLSLLPKESLYNSFLNGEEVSQILNKILGSNKIVMLVQGFSFFAIIHAIPTQALTLVHFLHDGLKFPSGKEEDWKLCFITLAPPLLFSLLFPNAFYAALSFAGGICAIILFGILPVFMVWKGRYKKKLTLTAETRGGKKVLIMVLLFSLFVLSREVIRVFF